MFGAKQQSGLPDSVLVYATSAASTSSSQPVPNSTRWVNMSQIKYPLTGYSPTIDTTQPGNTIQSMLTDGSWVYAEADTGTATPKIGRCKAPYRMQGWEWLELPSTLQYTGSNAIQIAPDGTVLVGYQAGSRTYLWQPGTSFLTEFSLPGRGINGAQVYVAYWNGSAFTVIYKKTDAGTAIARATVGVDGTVTALTDAVVVSGTPSLTFINPRQWRNPGTFLFSGDSVSSDGGATWTLSTYATQQNAGGWRQQWAHPTVESLRYTTTSSSNGGVTSYTVTAYYMKRDGTITSNTFNVPMVSPTTGMFNTKYYFNGPNDLYYINGTWLLGDVYGSLWRSNVDIASASPVWELLSSAFTNSNPYGYKMIGGIPGSAA